MKKNKTPLTYTPRQSEELQRHMEKRFGCTCEFVAHECAGEYVHVETTAFEPSGKPHAFVTLGMGARSMDTPLGKRRCELVMYSSEHSDVSLKKRMTSVMELVSIGRFPFRENCWLGTGHTIASSDLFHENFGYDGFAFWKLPDPIPLSGIDEPIELLQVLPLYKEEIQWCIQNHTLGLLEKLEEEYGRDRLSAEISRPPMIPEPLTEAECSLYNAMLSFGIDRGICEELFDWISSVESQGRDVTMEDVDQWLFENRD